MRVVEVDPELCAGAAECVSLAPAAFEQDEDGLSHATDTSNLDEATLDTVVGRCPAAAIRVTRQ